MNLNLRPYTSNSTPRCRNEMDAYALHLQKVLLSNKRPSRSLLSRLLTVLKTEVKFKRK